MVAILSLRDSRAIITQYLLLIQSIAPVLDLPQRHQLNMYTVTACCKLKPLNQHGRLDIQLNHDIVQYC